MVGPEISSRVPVSSAGPAISEDSIRTQLDRILTSHDFDAPERVRRFLAFIVQETLADRADRIKAYTIAIEVFGRGADFDNMNDPVVRIEAGRLRRALERYYLLEGRSDPLVIEVAKGGYVPRFRCPLNDQSVAGPVSSCDIPPSAQPGRRMFGWRKHPWLIGYASGLMISLFVALLAMTDRASPVAPATARPTLMVKPFTNLTGKVDTQAFAAALDDEILSKLALNEEVTLFRGEPVATLSRTESAAKSDRRLDRPRILEGAIRTNETKLRVTSRLLDGETNAILWSVTYEADQAVSGFDLETNLAGKIAAAVSRRLQSR